MRLPWGCRGSMHQAMQDKVWGPGLRCSRMFRQGTPSCTGTTSRMVNVSHWPLHLAIYSVYLCYLQECIDTVCHTVHLNPVCVSMQVVWHTGPTCASPGLTSMRRGSCLPVLPNFFAAHHAEASRGTRYFTSYTACLRIGLRPSSVGQHGRLGDASW